jgi:Ca2+-dependent lipid-binding protein
MRLSQVQTSAGFGKVKSVSICFGSNEASASWETSLISISSGKASQAKVGTIEQGVAFVTLVEAKDLPNADLGGKSDPFCIIYAGSDQRRSATVKDNLNPTWNEGYELSVISFLSFLCFLLTFVCGQLH